MITSKGIVGQVHNAQAVVCVWRQISHGETEPAVVCGGVVVVKGELREDASARRTRQNVKRRSRHLSERKCVCEHKREGNSEGARR